MKQFEPGKYRIFIDVDIKNENGEVEVTISGSAPQAKLPFAAVMAGTEHLMTMCAMHSPQGDFEKALELLCDGARTNRVLVCQAQKGVSHGGN